MNYECGWCHRRFPVAKDLYEHLDYVTTHPNDEGAPCCIDDRSATDTAGPSMSGGIDLTDDEFAAFLEAARGHEHNRHNREPVRCHRPGFDV